MRDNDSPQEEGQEGGRHNDGLDKEQNSELLDWHESQNCLGNPVKEEAQ